MKAIALWLLALAMNLQVGGAIQGDIDAQRLGRIPARMQELVDEGKIAGVVMVLVRHDRVALLEAVGYRDLAAREPMATDAIFRMASVAKPITAMGIMALQEDGRLSIYEPLARYLPVFEGLPVEGVVGPARPVRLRHLLSHTAGLAPENVLTPPDPLTRNLADNVAHYARFPLVAAPGERFGYSSAGFNTLGRVIEVVSGQSFAAFLDERIFRPLGMVDSGFFVPAQKRARIAGFYHFAEGRLQEGPPPGSHSGDMPHEGRVSPVPAFGLYSTAPDLAALLQMLLNQGNYEGHSILSPASVSQMAVDHGRVEGLPPRGLGWAIAPRGGSFGGPLASRRAYGHSGSTGVLVWVDPEYDLAGAFLVHQPGAITGEAAATFVNMATTALAGR